ncbi:MAG TPA: SDR family NAD(P)-dependent oxidoreductase [Spirochaetia bacterium]|nr:SDR family NAD(P)-dependent oxidoreductase [Spirochaetia bacterium]
MFKLKDRVALATGGSRSLGSGISRCLAEAGAHVVINYRKSKPEDIFEITLESWDILIRNNLFSTFLCAKKTMEIMKMQKYGRIIQISSMIAHQGALYRHVHYASTKSGRLGFTRTLARTAGRRI